MVMSIAEFVLIKLLLQILGRDEDAIIIATEKSKKLNILCRLPSTLHCDWELEQLFIMEMATV